MVINVYDVEQLDDVLVLRLLEEGDFSNRGTGHTLILALQPDLLQCDNAARIVYLLGLVDDAVRSW